MKIFGIGLSKTGTTSLATALLQLGFHATHRVPSGAQLDDYDAVTDELATQYASLDERFPNSKFILTVRDRDRWLNSCKHHFRRPMPADDPSFDMVLELYQTTQFDSAKFLEGYERHRQGITRYFQDRPNDLLVVDICEGNAWPPLCEFLDKPLPAEAFPKENTSRSLSRFWRRLKSWSLAAESTANLANKPSER